MRKVCRSHFYVIAFMCHVTPVFTGLNLLVCMLKSAIDAYTMVFAFRKVIQNFEIGQTWRKTVSFLGMLLILNLFCFLLKAFCENKWRPVAMKKLKTAIETRLFCISKSVELKEFDVPAFYQDLHWSLFHGYEYMEKVYAGSEKFCSALASVVSLTLVIGTVDYVALVLVILVVVAGVSLQVVKDRVSWERDMGLVKNEHRLEYIDKLFYQKEFLKEMRVQGFGMFFLKQFKKEERQIEEIYQKYGFRESQLTFIKNFFADSFPIYILYTGYLVWKTGVTGGFSLADFAALFTSIDVLKNNLMWMSDILAEAGKNALYIEKIQSVLEYQQAADQRMGADRNILPMSVVKAQFQNVYFSYGSGKDALKDVSFTISQGEKIALVGYNGAGKSTLLNLLLRLYDCSKGKILINGREILEYSFEELTRSFSSVFQDFHLLPVTIAENVAMGRAYDESKVWECLEKCGLRSYVESLPGGINTVITQEYADCGVGISGGQGQKIAVARALYHGSDFLILDEPASSMDPVSEYEFNDLIRKLDKTIIIVSHRLTTTYFMDKIILLADGKIKEQGSHKELMARKGEYYSLYRTQAERYRM